MGVVVSRARPAAARIAATADAVAVDGGGGMADFGVEPLSAVASELRQALTPEEVEEVVLLADRPGAVPYALPLELPPPGHALRERGLALLWARTVTVAAAIVGTSRLRLVTKCDETFERLKADFDAQPKVTSHLEQYGEFSLTRALPEDVPAELRAMPFLSARGGGVADEPLLGTNEAAPLKKRLYLGVDYGRSDVKCAVVDESGMELSTYVTRWWRPAEQVAEEREYLDPAILTSIDEPLRCLGEAALEVIRLALDAAGTEVGADGAAARLCGLGLSAAGCVRDGRLCGLPPAFGGCDPSASAGVLDRLEHSVLGYVVKHLPERLGSRLAVADGGGDCATMLVNDGDASAMWGSTGLCAAEGQDADAIGLYLSCGTGLAGGIVRQGGGVCGGGVLEVGKLVMGLPMASGSAPQHDTLGVAGVAQGMAGTQRSFFNLLAARGGERIEGKAEQRAAIVAMQKRPLDDEVCSIFSTLGGWLAQFVLELSEYLPFKLTHVEAGGKLTDAASGEIMLTKARDALKEHGISNVRRADESEFGQALALAKAVRSAKED